jgi:hypothetical protein
VEKYPGRLLQEWADITLAAQERFGKTFFNRSPMAYFVHNVQESAKGTRTPPDWWHEVRKEELRREAVRHRRRRQAKARADGPERAGDVVAQVVGEVTGDCRSSAKPVSQ